MLSTVEPTHKFGVEFGVGQHTNYWKLQEFIDASDGNDYITNVKFRNSSIQASQY